MSAALETEADQLAQADEKAVASVARARTDTGLAQDKRLSVLDMLSAYKFAMRGVKAPADQYEALGFDPPANPRNVTMPETPTELTATGHANGFNKLKFKGNNGPNTVNYILEANKGDGWFIIGTPPKPKLQTRRRHPRPRLPIPHPRPSHPRPSLRLVKHCCGL